MKPIASAYILGGLLVCGFAVPAFAADSAKTEPKTPWKIAGDLEEACSCRPACPCWFKSVPSRMTCDGVQAAFIRHGHYGKTSLDGLAFAQFVQSPEGKSMYESFGNWNLDNVYIDERANEEQRQALKAVAAHFFPPGGKSRAFHFVPISRTIEGPEHSVTVGSSGSFSGHLIEGGYAGSPKITNPPLADPTHRDFLQGQTTTLTYKEGSQGWNYQDSNYMFNRFKVDNKQYDKYEADLARKMAEASKKTGN